MGNRMRRAVLSRSTRALWLSCLLGLGIASCGGDDDTKGDDTQGDGDATGATAGNSGGSSGSGAADGSGGEPMGNSGGAPGLGGATGPSLVLASDQDAPTGIAVNGEHVYWANRGAGTIVRCPLSGCGADEPEVIVDGLITPMGISLDASNVYFMEYPNGTRTKPLVVMGCALPDCSGGPTLLGEMANASGEMTDVHFKNDSLFIGAWPNFASCDAGGCLTDGPVDLGGSPVVSVDTDDEYLYSARYGWGQISRCTLPDCTDLTPIVTVMQPLGLAVSDGSMYFGQAEQSSYGGAGGAMPSGTGWQILKCPISGCDFEDATVVTAGDLSPYALAIQGERLFFTNVEHGTVMSVAVE